MVLIVVLWYRFMTGLHMDGKIRKLPRSDKVKPQFRDYWWNKTTRPRRAAIRLSIVCAIGGIAIGRIYDWWLTRFALAAILPFVGLWLVRYVLRRTTVVTGYSDSDGVRDTYRHLRPKYARLVMRMRGWRFKLYGPKASTIDPTTPEARNVLAEGVEDGLPPVKRLERPIGYEDMLMGPAHPEGSSRGRTIARRGNRRR